MDEAGDALAFTDTLPGWPQHGARSLIEQATALEVTLENDVNLATMERSAAGIEDRLRPSVLAMASVRGCSWVVCCCAVKPAARVSCGLAVPRTAAIDPAAEDLTDLAGAPGVLAVLDAEPGESLEIRAALIGRDEAAALAARGPGDGGAAAGAGAAGAALHRARRADRGRGRAGAGGPRRRAALPRRMDGCAAPG